MSHKASSQGQKEDTMTLSDSSSAPVSSADSVTNDVVNAAKRISRKRAAKPAKEPKVAKAPKVTKPRKSTSFRSAVREVVADIEGDTAAALETMDARAVDAADLRAMEEIHGVQPAPKVDERDQALEDMREQVRALQAQLESMKAPRETGPLTGAIPMSPSASAVRKDVTDLIETVLGDEGPAFIPEAIASHLRGLLRGEIKPTKSKEAPKTPKA